MYTENKPTIYWSLLHHKEWKVYLATTSKGLCYVGSQNMSVDELIIWVEKHFPGSRLTQDHEKLKPWDALCEIPYGETIAYSDIANSINKPAAVRAVGAAIGANPVLISIPCHRVVGKNGKLTGYRGGLEMKTKLLELER